MVFEGLALKGQNVKILYAPITYCSTANNSNGSGWVKDAFQIFGIEWIYAINNLPSLYDNEKSGAILMHGMKSGLFTQQGFERLRKDDVLNNQSYEKYKNIFSQITEVDLDTIKHIANNPAFFYKLKYYPEFLKGEIRFLCRKVLNLIDYNDSFYKKSYKKG